MGHRSIEELIDGWQVPPMVGQCYFTSTRQLMIKIRNPHFDPSFYFSMCCDRSLRIDKTLLSCRETIYLRPLLRHIG
jgi:hypothetical protein